MNNSKVLFLVTIPSPYRVAFFNEFGKFVKLTVLFEKQNSEERDSSWEKFYFDNFEGILMDGIRTSVNTAFCPEVVKYLSRSWDHIIVANATTLTGMLAIQFMKMRNIQYWIEGDGGFAKSGKGIKELIKKHYHTGAKGYFSTGIIHDDYYITYGANPNAICRYPFTSLSEEDLRNAKSINDKNTVQIEKNLNEYERRKIIRTIARNKLGFPLEKKIILFVGQLIPRKGIDVMIRVAADIKKLDDGILFYIVGGTPSEEYMSLKESLEADNVFFSPFMVPEKLIEYYRSADIFLLPTREDIWGLVVNEAMAYGLPVVTTDHCAAGLELIQDGENGFIVPVEDTQATINAIMKIIESDSNAMGINSYTIIKNYTYRSMAEAHMKALGVES